MDETLGFMWGPLLSKVGTGLTKGLELYGAYKGAKAAGGKVKPIPSGYTEYETVTARPFPWQPVLIGGGILLGALFLMQRRRR